MVASILPLRDASTLNDFDEEERNRKLIRNRLAFSVIPLLFIALDSPQSLRYLASYFLTVTEWSEVQSSFRQLQNKTSAYEHLFIRQSEQHLAYQQDVVIPSFFELHDLALSHAIIDNVNVLAKHEQHNLNSTMALQTTVDFLRAWSKLGNDMHYKLTRPAEQKIYEAKYGLANNNNQGPLVIGIISSSQILRTSIQQRMIYDEEYIANKTRGLDSLVPAVQLSLDATLLVNDVIRNAALASKNQLLSSFRALRQHYAELYKSLTAQLANSRNSLDVIADAYDELVDFSIRVTSFLATIPIPAGHVVPTINLGDFPPGDFFKPDFSGFPPLQNYLGQFDSFILQLDAAFDDLGDGLIATLYDILKNGADDVMEQIANIVITTDYHPPGIEVGETLLTPTQAFEHLNALEMDLYNQFQFGFNLTEPGDLLVNVTPIEIPTESFTSETVAAFQTAVEYFDVAMPTLKISPSLLEMIHQVVYLVNMLLVGTVGFVVLFVYRSMLQIFSYWDGSAIHTPTVDMRTKSEKALEKKRSRKAAMAVLVVETAIRGHLTTLLQYSVIAGLAVMVSFLVYTYEVQSFRPNCVESRQGTLFGQYTIAPLFYNRALIGAQSEVLRHNAALQVFAQNQCHMKTVASLEAVRDQSKQYVTFQQLEAVKQNFANEIQEAQNMDALCRDLERKCGTFSDECPVQEDGTVFESPCFLLSRIESLSAPLEMPRVNCSNIPINVLKARSAEEIEKELAVAESSCILEAYLLSTFWLWAFMIFSWTLLKDVIRPLLIGGLHVVLRHFLAREEFKVNVTTFADGQFSEPEYNELEERKQAVQHKLVWMRFFGWSKVVFGSVFLVGWVMLLIEATKYSISRAVKY